MLSFLSIFNKSIISPLGKTTSKPKHRSLVLPYFKTFIPPAFVDDGFENKSQNITENLYKIIEKLNGSFSAEHGIGQLKKDNLRFFKDPVAYDLMRNIKYMIDPKNIMNPGKILI